MGDLKKFYDDLVENPYRIFLVQPDGKILSGKEIYAVADADEGTFSLNELVIYPGSFNPLHAGHRTIFDRMGIPGSPKNLYELSLSRWQKSNLTFEELEERLKQFEWYAPVLVTNAPTFLEKIGVIKSLHVRGLDFHIGIDTIKRMIEHYGPVGVSGLEAHFVVWDRDLGNGVEKYPLPEWKILPTNVSRTHKEVPPELLDISSTKIREQQKTKE